MEKTLKDRKIEGKRREWERMRRLDNIPDSMDMYCVLSLQSCPILVNP